MHGFIRSMAVAGAALAAVALTGAPAMASASGHHHHHAPAQVKVVPHLAGGNYQFQETNGNYYVGSFDLSAGTAVVERTLARNFTFTVVTTYGGSNAGYLQFSNGNFLAATNNCDNGTIKSDSASNGTVWAPKFSGTTGAYYLVNRYCSQNAGNGATVYLAGRNNLDSQFLICNSFGGGCGGLFTKMTPS